MRIVSGDSVTSTGLRKCCRVNMINRDSEKIISLYSFWYRIDYTNYDYTLYLQYRSKKGKKNQ